MICDKNSHFFVFVSLTKVTSYVTNHVTYFCDRVTEFDHSLDCEVLPCFKVSFSTQKINSSAKFYQQILQVLQAGLQGKPFRMHNIVDQVYSNFKRYIDEEKKEVQYGVICHIHHHRNLYWCMMYLTIPFFLSKWERHTQGRFSGKDTFIKSQHLSGFFPLKVVRQALPGI